MMQHAVREFRECGGGGTVAPQQSPRCNYGTPRPRPACCIVNKGGAKEELLRSNSFRVTTVRRGQQWVPELMYGLFNAHIYILFESWQVFSS